MYAFFLLYMISFFQLSKGALKRLDYFLSRLFSQGDNDKRKYRLEVTKDVVGDEVEVVASRETREGIGDTDNKCVRRAKEGMVKS